LRCSLLTLAALLLSACEPAARLVPADPSYAADVQPVFNRSCIGCHSAASPAGDYSLTSRAGALGPGADSVPNAVAGDAGASRLYLRITGAETPLMPQGGPPLDTVETGTVRNWIDKGTKDN